VQWPGIYNLLDGVAVWRPIHFREKTMPRNPSLHPSWDTSSFGHPPDISVLERSALVDHLAHCCAQRRPFQALRNGAIELQGMLAGHVITSVVALSLLVGGTWLML